jgi:2-polyprenyl-6-methoxyphenol hydroxylase-like FAD-dependent oxidoreductase
MSNGNGHRPGGAIVIGGGFCGVLMAAALAEHMDVTVVERDELPEGPVFHPGVPHARHAHILLEGGQRALDTLLPGILDELVAAGATRVGLPASLLWLSYAGWAGRFPVDATTFLTCTRPLLDWTIRRRVAAHPRIRFHQGATVTGLVASDGAVRGVRIRQKDGTQEELTATVVVDASGRGSQAPKWLEELGYPVPVEELIDSGMAYATRLFRRTPDFDVEGFQAVNIQPHLSFPRFGLLIPAEENRWLVALGGLRGHEPPNDPDAWLEFAASLRSPVIHRLLVDAEPVTPVYGFRNTQNRRRYYEKLGRHPEGLLVLGDAACTFNPVYGQGMSVSAMEAVALRDLVGRRGTGPGLSAEVRKLVARTVKNPWLMATSEDRKYPTTVGGRRRGAADRAADWYLDRVMAEALVNPRVLASFLRVVALVDPPGRLFSPQVALPSLRPKHRPAVPEPVLKRPSGNTPRQTPVR